MAAAKCVLELMFPKTRAITVTAAAIGENQELGHFGDVLQNISCCLDTALILMKNATESTNRYKWGA